MMCVPRAIQSSDPGAAGERGSALILAVIALVVLAVMGTALMLLGRTDSETGLNGKQAFYLAETGLEDGRATLLAAEGAARITQQLAVAAGANNVIDFIPTRLNPMYDTSGALTGFTGYGDDVPLRVPSPFGEGWYAAFLTNDSVDGVLSVSDTNDRVLITGVGASRGNSLEMVQAIVEPPPALPPSGISTGARRPTASWTDERAYKAP